jgi:hypothetical protein
MATSAKIFSGPLGPGVGKARELDAGGGGVWEPDPEGVAEPVTAEDPPADADPPPGAAEDDVSEEPAPRTCDDGMLALTDAVTAVDGVPERVVVQAVLASANPATAQPVASARKTPTASMA